MIFSNQNQFFDKHRVLQVVLRATRKFTLKKNEGTTLSCCNCCHWLAFILISTFTPRINWKSFYYSPGIWSAPAPQVPAMPVFEVPRVPFMEMPAMPVFEMPDMSAFMPTAARRQNSNVQSNVGQTG